MRAATLTLPPHELDEAPTAVMERLCVQRSGPWDTEAVLASREATGVQPSARPSQVRVSGAYHCAAPTDAVTEVRMPDSEHDGATGHEREQADELFRIAEVLLERGHAREAVFRAQRALKLCKPRPAQQALYAWLLYLRGDRSQPVAPHVWEHLEEALRADPQCERALHYRSLLMRAP